jgi:CRP-like cAMP-binding protein
MPYEIVPNLPAVLGEIAYFRQLTEESLHRLTEQAYVLSLNKGDVLVAKDAPRIDGLFAVLEGQIHLYIPLPDVTRTLLLIDPGMTLGESILLRQVPTPYEAAATRKSRVLVLDGARWLSELRGSPDMALAVLNCMAENQLNAMSALARNSRRSDLSRVATYLLDHRPRIQSESYSFELPARKMDIASLLGMSNASFSRALQQLKANGLIQVEGSCIQVLRSSELTSLIAPKSE